MSKNNVIAVLAFLAVLAVMIIPQVAGFKVTDVLGNPEPLPQEVLEVAEFSPVALAIVAGIVIVVLLVAFGVKLFSEPAGG